VRRKKGLVCLLVAGDYTVGDPSPDRYNAWHEWAKGQYNGGLRQRRCPTCLKARFPQEKCCEEVSLPMAPGMETPVGIAAEQETKRAESI
jgi:hypothetical protein